MYKPQYTIMLYTDGIEDHGASHDVLWHALVYLWDEGLELGKYEWHYYGTVMPNPLPFMDRYPTATGVQHEATHFPSALNDLPDGDGGLYDLARSAEYNRLSL